MVLNEHGLIKTNITVLFYSSKYSLSGLVISLSFPNEQNVPSKTLKPFILTSINSSTLQIKVRNLDCY